MYLFEFKAKVPFKGSKNNKLYHKYSQTKFQQYWNHFFWRNSASPELLTSSMRRQSCNFPMLYYITFSYPQMLFFLPWDLWGGTWRDPLFPLCVSLAGKVIWGCQKETQGLPGYGAEQHMGKHSHLLPLPVRNCRLGGAQPWCPSKWPLKEGQLPETSEVLEFLIPEIPVRNLAPRHRAINCRQCLCVLKTWNSLKHAK